MVPSRTLQAGFAIEEGTRVHFPSLNSRLRSTQLGGSSCLSGLEAAYTSCRQEELAVHLFIYLFLARNTPGTRVLCNYNLLLASQKAAVTSVHSGVDYSSLSFWRYLGFPSLLELQLHHRVKIFLPGHRLQEQHSPLTSRTCRVQDCLVPSVLGLRVIVSIHALPFSFL